MVVDISVDFPGGKRVVAHLDGKSIPTDRPVEKGGSGSAPEPMDLLFASLATCVGSYALEFCDARKLDTTGLRVDLHSERDEASGAYRRVRVDVGLPESFPEKYRGAILRAVDLCTVKKLILNPPEFEVACRG